jgi:pyrroline-5-carboxylate reductase
MLERGAIRSTLMDAVEAASKRARELGTPITPTTSTR